MEKLKFVKEITPVYGEYDMIVKTETETIKELTVFIYNRLRTIPVLTMTTTMITTKKQKTEL
jgi:anthranilate phosphoribosyltransferase